MDEVQVKPRERCGPAFSHFIEGPTFSQASPFTPATRFAGLAETPLAVACYAAGEPATYKRLVAQ